MPDQPQATPWMPKSAVPIEEGVSQEMQAPGAGGAAAPAPSVPWMPKSAVPIEEEQKQPEGEAGPVSYGGTGFEDIGAEGARQAPTVAGRTLLGAAKEAGKQALQLPGQVFPGVPQPQLDVLEPKGPVEEAGAAALNVGMLAMAAPEIAAWAAPKIAALRAPNAIRDIQEINELMGVKPSQLRLSKTAASPLQADANAARGLVAEKLDAKQLEKMNPFERRTAIDKLRDATGQELDRVLDAATQRGIRIDLEKPIQRAIDNIDDPAIRAQVKDRLAAIMKDSDIRNMDSLSPTDARRIQRGLDNMAGGVAKARAKPIRRAISEATRKAVPESIPLDQHYGDLQAAWDAADAGARKFAVKVPETNWDKFWANPLVKRAIQGAGWTAGAGTAYEIYKHIFKPILGAEVLPPGNATHAVYVADKLVGFSTDDGKTMVGGMEG